MINALSAAVTTLILYGIMFALSYYDVVKDWDAVVHGFVAVLIYRSFRDGGRLDDLEGK